jgi:hypothetical protein
MTATQIKRLEKIASESVRYARKAMQKSDEMRAYLSALEYKAGKTKEFRSVDDLFRRLKVR